MSESKMTEGPWYVGTMNDALFVINEPPRPAPIDYHNPSLKTKVIAKVSEPHQEGWSVEEYQANAKAIAALPDLIEACKTLVNDWERNLTKAVHQADSALKKAGAL